jgi:hypothetical protein
VFVLSQLHCAPPSPPPPGAGVVPPNPPDFTTTRDFFAKITAAPACQACHKNINAIGDGLESYDGIGNYRTTENGHPVDASGALNVSDQAGSFNGAIELAAHLAKSRDVRKCVVKQWFRYGYGRTEIDADKAILDQLDTKFAAAGTKIASMPGILSSADSFYRLHYATKVKP